MAGRKKIEIDWKQVNSLLEIQCTGKEVASVLDISYNTLERRCKEVYGINYEDWSAVKRQTGHASLRRMQWKAAEKGNTTMLIWLGKQVLGQMDRPIEHGEHTKEGFILQIEPAQKTAATVEIT